MIRRSPLLGGGLGAESNTRAAGQRSLTRSDLGHAAPQVAVDASAAVEPASITAQFLNRQLRLFEERCNEIVERVDAGTIAFIDGVDMLHSAALWSGLSDNVGDDLVQAVMARAFMGARRT
jgi:hypothetical protein